MNLDCTTQESMDVLSNLACLDGDRYYELSTEADSDNERDKERSACNVARRFDDFTILRDVFADRPVVSSGSLVSVA
jgi:hypothetical protein